MQCNECGATISEKAADCPRCGASVRDLAGGEDTHRQGTTGPGDAGDGVREEDERGSPGETDSDRTTPSVPGTESSRRDSHDTETRPGDESVDTTDTPSERPDTAGTPERPDTAETPEPEGTGEPDVGVGDAGAEDTPTENGTAEGHADGSAGEGAGVEETGWEAAGPPPEEQETGVGQESAPGTESETGEQEPTVPGTEEVTTAGTTELEDSPESGGRGEFGGEAGGGEQSPAVTEPAASDEAGEHSSTGELDPVAQLKSLPLVTAPLAGVVTAVVLGVLSTVVGVLTPNTGSDPVAVGATVLLDLQFATDGHLPVGLLTQFETARPPNATLGILYLLPPLFLYTAAKFVTAYNTDEETLTPVAAVGGALVAVGYLPAMLVALFLTPGGPVSTVKLLPAILLAGIVYPVFFGGIGGLVAGALSGSERRIGTLYGVVGFFLIAVGSLVLTVPAIQLSDVGLLPQIHASLFTVVAVNGLRLGSPDIGALVLLAYPMVALVAFAAGALRAWNAADVTGPLRGVAKGLSPVATYCTLLALLATALPLLADPWVARELGLSPNGEALVRGLVQSKLYTIGQYVTAVFVGTLVYAVLLGGCGGLVAGTARYVLSDDT